MLKIRKRIATEGVILLEFGTQYELASTFLRFQEHYESPKFRGKVFTLEQYMDWYASVRGNFTYYEDWGGFNVPSEVLAPFRRGLFDPLLQKERALLDLVAGEKEPFYLLGVHRQGQGIARENLQHEVAHGLFYARPEFRREALSCLAQYDTRSVRKRLRGVGYHARVANDETIAYLVADAPASAGEKLRLAPLRKRLRALFRKHGGTAVVDRLLRRGRPHRSEAPRRPKPH